MGSGCFVIARHTGFDDRMRDVYRTKEVRADWEDRRTRVNAAKERRISNGRVLCRLRGKEARSYNPPTLPHRSILPDKHDGRIPTFRGNYCGACGLDDCRYGNRVILTRCTSL